MMHDIIMFFQNNWSGFLMKTWEHLYISLIAGVLGILVAVPLGIAMTRFKKGAGFILGVLSVIQTFPSFAILAFFIPILGVGKIPAIVALFFYSVLPILRNTYTGVSEVDPALVEAATGMGMNSWKRLAKIELPLALPVLMAGIRTSMVLIIGTATIAALIGAGGLGELILLGLDRGADVNLILLGAIPAALLAILLDVFLRVFEKYSKRGGIKAFIFMLIAVLLIAVIPSAFQVNKKTDIVIGAKLGSEPEILINMYKLLIEENTDLTVSLKPGLGKTSFVFKALKNGDIDLYPEFTGTAIVTQLEEKAKSNDAAEVYKQAKQGMQKKYQMTLLKPMEYNNTYTVATTPAIAKKYGLKTIDDLRQTEDQLTAGFTLEFKDRQDGYRGMQSLYDIKLNQVKTMDPGIRQKALQNGEVDIIDAYATDSYMVKLGLVTLKDPKHLFPPYQGAPLLKTETLKQHPELKPILNRLAGKITDEEMRKMNYEVDEKDRAAQDVAKAYLVKHGLLKN